MLFRIDLDGKTAEAVPANTFSDLQVRERYDIQEWVLANPELLGERLLVLSSEFSGFDRTSERLDVLAMDVYGKLVVVELKRTAIGTLADLQALRYAAFCSTLKLNDVAELRVAHRRRRGQDFTLNQALDEIRDFVEHLEFQELDDKPRIILAADSFDPEMTATVLWLRAFEVDIRCVRLTPYSVGGQLVIDATILIPLPEAQDFVIRREKKEATRSSGGRAPRPSLEEFIARIPDQVRPLFTEIRGEILRRPGVKETVFNKLITYRRASDNAWITWLAYTSKQARIGFPDDLDTPEEMSVRSDGEWTTLGVNEAEQIAVVGGLIDDLFAWLAGTGGNSTQS
jgi:hypothetical protein